MPVLKKMKVFRKIESLISTSLIIEDPAPNLIPAFKTNVESFSFYFNKDRKLDKGPKVEINSYSQVKKNQMNLKFVVLICRRALAKLDN